MTFMPVLVMDLILLTITVLISVAEHFLVRYGECQIVINKGRTLTVQGGGTLLESFSASKIFVPSACGGKATCGHCKTKILEGAQSILPTEEAYITREEAEAGIRLACQVKVKNDIEVYIPEYLLEAKEYSGKVEDISQLTHDIKRITVRLEQGEEIKFMPGQYIQIRVPGTDEFRAYSIGCPPSSSEEIELIIRLVPRGLCSTYVHEVLEVGDLLALTGPFGEFFLREDSTNDIVLIGGGCGMAPIRSILLHLVEKGMLRKAIFFFGARAKADLFFTEELKRIEEKNPNFKYVPALSEPKATDKWDGETGFITQVVDRYISDGSRMEAYLCGPPPMIDAAIRVLTSKNIPEESILYDKF